MYDLKHVVTTSGPKGGEYAHIYIEDNSSTYQFRLQLYQDYTWLGYKAHSKSSDLPTEIIILPGFPVTPSNAKEQLERLKKLKVFF